MPRDPLPARPALGGSPLRRPTPGRPTPGRTTPGRSTLKRPPVRPLDAHLGYWLRRLSSQVSHACSLKLEKIGVTVAEWIVLRQLYDGELMPSALAEKVGLKRAAISKLAERLVAKRMIEQRPSGGDRRAQTLALSTIGRAIVPTLATLAEESEEELFGFLDRDARESLKATLREIVRRHKVRAAAVDRGGGAPSDRAD